MATLNVGNGPTYFSYFSHSNLQLKQQGSGKFCMLLGTGPSVMLGDIFFLQNSKSNQLTFAPICITKQFGENAAMLGKYISETALADEITKKAVGNGI